MTTMKRGIKNQAKFHYCAGALCLFQIFRVSLRSQPPEQRGAVPPGSGHGLVSPAQQPGDRLQQVHLAQGHG